MINYTFIKLIKKVLNEVEIAEYLVSDLDWRYPYTSISSASSGLNKSAYVHSN